MDYKQGWRQCQSQKHYVYEIIVVSVIILTLIGLRVYQNLI